MAATFQHQGAWLTDLAMIGLSESRDRRVMIKVLD
jgi:hypothetical protein